MKETFSNVIEMPEDACDAFNELAMYLYNRHLPVDHSMPILRASEAWILADKLCMPEFQDFLINRMMQFTRQTYIGPVSFTLAMERLPKEYSCLQIRPRPISVRYGNF